MSSAVTYPAAPTPARVRAFRRGAAVALAVAAVGAAAVVRGSGVGGLLAGIALLCAMPVLWQLAMIPHAYTVEGTRIHVHRRWLPDSSFEMRGTPERLSVAQARAPIAARGQEGFGDSFARLSRTRVLSATTDVQKGVRVAIGRSGALVISPAEPDEFVQASGGGQQR